MDKKVSKKIWNRFYFAFFNFALINPMSDNCTCHSDGLSLEVLIHSPCCFIKTYCRSYPQSLKARLPHALLDAAHAFRACVSMVFLFHVCQCLCLLSVDFAKKNLFSFVNNRHPPTSLLPCLSPSQEHRYWCNLVMSRRCTVTLSENYFRARTLWF